VRKRPCHPLESQQIHRPAGLGILIINNHTHPTQNIYIQGAIHNATSILMVEAAALALEALMASRLDLQSPTYLSDNQGSGNFLEWIGFLITARLESQDLHQQFHQRMKVVIAVRDVWPACCVRTCRCVLGLELAYLAGQPSHVWPACVPSHVWPACC